MRARARLLTVAAASAVALSLTGCSAINDLIGGSDPVRGENGEITEASDADATAIEVGDCLDAAALSGSIETVPTKPCSEAHDAEVFAAKDLPAGDYPTDIVTQAQDFCSAEFEPYVGVAYEESELALSYLYPEAAGWTLGDREISCLAILEAGGLTESVKGSGR